MANFALGNANVLKQKTTDFLKNVEGFVEKAARNAPYNRLATAPPNFGKVQEGNKVISKHEASGVVFKAGFQMIQGSGSCKWEGQVVGDGLRLDLQGIANGYANWQVQTNKAAQESETIAGCLMQVNSCFSQRHLVHALKMSHNEGKIVTLTMPT
jgi:hypothetical protein